MPDRSPIEQAAVELLTALDAMHNRALLSLNVMDARERLRAAITLRVCADAEQERFAA